jgi:hypothetical protein
VQRIPPPAHGERAHITALGHVPGTAIVWAAGAEDRLDVNGDVVDHGVPFLAVTGG